MRTLQVMLNAEWVDCRLEDDEDYERIHEILSNAKNVELHAISLRWVIGSQITDVRYRLKPE